MSGKRSTKPGRTLDEIRAEYVGTLVEHKIAGPSMVTGVELSQNRQGVWFRTPNGKVYKKLKIIA